MKATFVTSGEVTAAYNEDGEVFGYNVGRQDMGSIFLTKAIGEFFQAGNQIVVDAWGSFWVKK